MMKVRYQKFLILVLLGLALITSACFLFYFRIDVSVLQNKFPTQVSDRVIVYSEKRPDHWVSLERISSGAKWPIIISEDWAFFQHRGVDFNQLIVVIKEFFLHQELRGASTISQQLVKNLFLSPEKTFLRKLQEWILTYKLEQHFSKNKILEMYLNVIEFGPKIYGIKRASEYYFNKSPGDLNFREGSFLAMLLPNPKIYHSSFTKKKLTSYARSRIEITLDKLKMAKILDEENLKLEKNRKFGWEL